MKQWRRPAVRFVYADYSPDPEGCESTKRKAKKKPFLINVDGFQCRLTQREIQEFFEQIRVALVRSFQ